MVTVACALSAAQVRTLWEEGGAEADESTHIQLVKVQAVLDGSAPDETDAAPALQGVCSE